MTCLSIVCVLAFAGWFLHINCINVVYVSKNMFYYIGMYLCIWVYRHLCVSLGQSFYFDGPAGIVPQHSLLAHQVCRKNPDYKAIFPYFSFCSRFFTSPKRTAANYLLLMLWLETASLFESLYSFCSLRRAMTQLGSHLFALICEISRIMRCFLLPPSSRASAIFFWQMLATSVARPAGVVLVFSLVTSKFQKFSGNMSMSPPDE